MVVDLSPSSAKSDAPTNPKFSDSSVASIQMLYTAIATDGASTFSASSITGAVPEENLATTKGFRIKCYDALTTEGFRFNPTDFTDYYYFVLVHAREDKKHHFARITEFLTEDIEGDAFEFEPKLGNEIPKGTQFHIIKGHARTNTNIVAFSGGIYVDKGTGLSLNENLVCARPLFYFFNDLLDKKNELDHNTKYYCMQKNNFSSATLTFDTTDAVVFRTVQDFGKTVIDYSKFSHRVTLTDKLRGLDNTITQGDSITTNEGATITADTNDYNAMFPNARRISDDLLSTPTYTGPTRYLHYDFSPTKANILYNVYEHNNTESIDGKGGFSETSVLDSARIITKKVSDFTPYRVRHNIHRGDLNAFFPLAATYSSKTSNAVFSFETEYNLNTVLNVGDEVKLGDNILIVQSFGGLSGTTQEITFQSSTEPYARTENDAAFTAQSTTPTSGDVLHRRAYNATDGTLMLDTHLINGRFSKMYVAFTSLNHNERFATITACDAVKGMITLSFSGDSYNSNPLSFAKGQYQIFIERFNGEVETIESKKVEGQTLVEITGRDKFNKLLSPVINSNTLFSNDIIYSTNSPYNQLTNIKDGTTHTIAFAATTLDTGQTTLDVVPSQNDYIFSSTGVIGKISSVTGGGSSNYVLNFSASMNELTNAAIYVSSVKNYILNKALSSSHYNTKNPSSLTGAAHRGFIFTSGVEISGSTEGNPLTGTSNSQLTGALGYDILHPSSIKNDLFFQTKLTNTSKDTINSLIDFEIVEIVKNQGESQITLAPYVPITLGRKIKNYGNSSSYTFTERATIQNTLFGGVTLNSAFPSLVEVATDGIKNMDFGDPVFIGGSGATSTFAGYITDFLFIKGQPDFGPVLILDRDVSPTTGHKVFSVSKDTHDLFFSNGEHLWGGKILTMPHPKITSSGGVPLNFENIYSSNTTTAEKYGQPYYKLLSMSNGNFNLLNSKSTDVDDSQNNMYENASKLKYHSISYKFSPNIASDNLNVFDKTGTGDNIQMDFDSRGYGSPYGSIFNGQNIRLQRTDTNIKYPNTFNATDLSQIERLKSTLEQKDTSAATLFFYVNSDILPYSSLRQDSLMDGNKDIQKYNMFLVQNNRNTDGKLEFTETTGGERKLLTDESFETISFDSEQDISTLKRFGMMRLTELCFDAHFNPINPEKRTVEDKDFLRVADFDAYNFSSTSNTIHVSNSESAGNNQIVLDTVGGSNPANGEVLYDSDFRLIGTVNSYASGSKTITFTDEVALNYNNTFTSGLIYKRTAKLDVNLKGTKGMDTFITQDRAHLQKGALITQNYASHANDFWADNSDNHSVVLTFDAADRISLPFRFNYSNSSDLTSANYYFPSRLFRYFYVAKDQTFNQCKAIVLDSYAIEQGGLVSVENGLAIPSTGIRILQFDDATSEHTDFFMLKNGSKTFGKEFPQSSASTGLAASGSARYEASGAKLCFTARLTYVQSEHDTPATISSSNGDLYSVGLNAFSTAGNGWLDFIDITGCYLVSESGFDTELKAAQTTGGTQATTMRRMDNSIPEEIIYVISHEINNSGSIKHNLTTDFPLTDGRSYRIMKPNETAFYANSPKKININTLSPKYTKEANSDRMYSPKQDYEVKEGSRDKFRTIAPQITNNAGPVQEAILSMYVIIDLDKQSSNENYIVMRKAKNFLDLLPEGSHNLYMTDGENNQLTSVNVRNSATFSSGAEKQVLVTFGEMKEMHGIVSVSEPFTVSSFNEINIEPTRACIGTTVSVGLEGEDLINELLEREGIVFDIPTNESPPIFMSPNFQGVDLYSALRFVAERKNMKLVEENDVFKVLSENDNSIRTNITIDDTGDYLISEFDKTTTLFDFFNEIIVYGQSHKSSRKDIRSIQKVGRKSLEVVDSSLITQEEVNSKAIKLLRLHSKLNTKLSFTMHNKGINQLRVGDIINVSIPREDIQMSEYIILEMEHQLSGFIKLELGRYTKDLSDIFSELLISSKETKAALRKDKLITSEVSFNFINTIDTKELKLLVRKREASGATRTLGFGTTFGFSSNSQLGFTGGAIVITDLIEEDLA